MTEITSQNPITYFCAEYGIQANLPLYAGGLGILAGDTIKAAADANLPFVGVGLLYRGERSIQEINDDGMQIEKDMDFDPVDAGLEHVYIDDQPVFVRVHLTEIDIWARVWKKTFNDNVILYLLDTDTDQNQTSERSITHALYSGTAESILKQQFILGIGGVKLLHILGIRPCVYHLNEGRPAFLYWQLIRSYMDEHGVDYFKAKEVMKDKIVYTNHTLVVAGNNSVEISLLSRYAGYYAQKMNISLEQLLEDGKQQGNGHFLMTRFSLNISKKANGVSSLHTTFCKRIWPEYNWVNITNGVHMPTWQDSEIASCDLAGDDLWHLHLKKKKELADFVAEKAGFGYDENRLVITWARRLAEYKRLKALFADIERIRSIMRHSERPVQLLIAGKAHILDTHGKIMLQEIIKFMAKELSGHAIFVPDYNLDVAAKLVKGSDLWVNIPEYGREACGTSGMKAIANGVLHCSTMDGWTPEIDWKDVGWTLQSEDVSNDFYKKMEDEIPPLYYKRDANGVPKEWLEMMKKSIKVAEKYSAKRMLKGYQELLYKDADC